MTLKIFPKIILGHIKNWITCSFVIDYANEILNKNKHRHLSMPLLMFMGWDPVALSRHKPLGSGSTACRNDGLNGLFEIEVTLID